MAQARDEAGNIWELDAQGNAVRLVSQAGGPQMPADPTFPYQAPKVRADINSTQTNTEGQQIDNRVAGATVQAQIDAANADAETKKRAAKTAGLPEGFQWSPDGQTSMPIPGYTRQGLSPEIRAKALSQWESAQTLDRTIKQLEELYQQGPGSTSGVRGLQDFLPTTANQRFDRAANASRGIVRNALGLTGGEANTAAEAQMNLGAYVPQSSDRDATIQDSLERLRSLRDQARSQATATLGGTPDANGNITPLPNAMQQTFIGGGDPLQAAAFGTDRGITEQYPPEMIAAHEALVGRLMMQGGGRIDPQAYAQARGKLNQQFGFEGDPQADVAWANQINDYLSKGGKNVPGGITPAEQPLSSTDQFRNNLINTPIGAFAANVADMGGLGLVSLATGDKMSALNEGHPLASTLGQIGGSITGAGATGKLLGAGVSKFAPKIASKLLGGDGVATVARNIGTDTLYSGITGMNQGQDPLESAAWGAGGSLFGTGVGKALGSALGGVAASAPAQALRARGIPLTVGQTMGGFAKGVEDKATSIPFVGDMINARRLEGLQGFNKHAFNDAGAPIGAKVNEIGQDGLTELLGAAGDPTNNGLIGNAYDSATAGARVPLDGQYMQDFSNVTAMGHKLPDDLRAKFALALNNRINPINDAGEMTGDSYQQAVRGLKSYRAENVKPGFEQDYREALTGAQDALTGQMQRGGGQGVVDGLKAADAAYRNAKTLQDAVGRAKGGSMSGELHTFTPSQLQGAVARTQSKFPGAHPLEGLANNGQAVLPSRVPDSGTAGRLAMQGGGLIGLGTGGGALIGGVGAENGQGIQGAQGGAANGALYSALLTGALLAGGTRGGQKALVKMLADRPDSLKKAGAAINRKKGLFGRAALPFVLSDQ